MPVGHYGHRGRKTKMHQTPPRPARWPNGSSTIDSPLFSSGVLCLCLLFIPVSSTPKAGEFGVRCDNRRRQFHPKKWRHGPDKWAIVARDMPVLVREIAVEKLVDCCCWWWCCHCDRRNGAQDELEFSVPEMTTVLRVYVPGGNHQGKVVEVGCIRLQLAVVTVAKVPCLTYNPGAHCTYGGE